MNNIIVRLLTITVLSGCIFVQPVKDVNMTKEELIEKTDAVRHKMELASAYIDDDNDALDCIDMFPEWTAGKHVIVGEKLRYGLHLYKCIQEHDTQLGWEPPVTQALWMNISLEPYPEWKQPHGSADAYMKNDTVRHNGSIYISNIDYNVWEPGVVGYEIWSKGYPIGDEPIIPID